MLEENYKSIRTPVLAESERDNRTGAKLDIENVKCVLRFPYFNKVWASDSIDYYEDDALNRFPIISEVLSLLNTEAYNDFPMSPGDAHFWKCLKSCSATEIYFLDSYFSAKNLARLLDVLKYMDCQSDRELTEIRVYTCAKHEWCCLKNEFERCREEPVRFEKIKLFICRLDDWLLDKLHDRFALLGSSLWHFGASAGAMHTNINAYSGSWLDKTGSCMEFMRNLRDRYVAEEMSTIQMEVK